jgi:hypothetical protein
MNYAEFSVFGVYIDPLAPMLVLAGIFLVVFRRVGDAYGWFRHVWHPALFVFAVYVIMLAAIVLLARGRLV